MKASDEVLASVIYEKYSEAVGGVAWNGDPLPSWSQFRTDPAKQKQSQGWIEAARAAREFLTVPGGLLGTEPERTPEA